MKDVINKILLTIKEIIRYNEESKAAIESHDKKISEFEKRIRSLESRSHGDYR